MHVQRNDGQRIELTPGTILAPEVIWADSFRVKYEGVKNNRAYFDVLSGWERHGVQLSCRVADLAKQAAQMREDGLLEWLRHSDGEVYRHNKANYVTL